MKVITFSNLKGGTGKTTTAILTANILSGNGFKVLCIDLDIQNSLTLYYLNDFEQIEQKNIYNVFQDEPLQDNIININENLDLIPSELNLIDKRNTARLNYLTKALKNLEYDFIIIDTAPTFDNVLINAYKATDLLIIPTQLALFDFKAVMFLIEQFENYEINTETRILLNRVKHNEEQDNIYYKAFIETFNSKVLPVFIPETTLIKKAIERKEVISTAKNKIKTFTALNKFIDETVNVKNQMELF